MFPDAHDDPAHPPKFLERLPIASTVAVDLRLPILAELVAPAIESPTVPKVPIDENRDFVAPESKVWFAGQVGDVSLRSSPPPLKEERHGPFQGGVFSLDGLHGFPALFRGKIVRQPPHSVSDYRHVYIFLANEDVSPG